MRRQAELAIEQADVILLITDLLAGVTANDKATLPPCCSAAAKPVLLCVNKCDSLGDLPADFYEFYNLGLGDPSLFPPFTATGTGDLLDAIFGSAPSGGKRKPRKPRVHPRCHHRQAQRGQVLLINRIAGEERVIVSDRAGTTRDTTDTEIHNEQGGFPFHRHRRSAP